jgi:hypothetical protein
MMKTSIFLRALVTFIGAAILLLGLFVLISSFMPDGNGWGRRHQRNEFIEQKHVSHRTGGKESSVIDFTLVQWGSSNVVLVGTIPDNFFLLRASRWDSTVTEVLHSNSPCFEVIPSRVLYKTKRFVGAVMSLVVGILLLAVARDLWVVRDIELGKKRFWILFSEK